ncbi:MAG: zf-HC2 domain-containing protein [Acidobacteria bacterium]|nr:zf-HC2 domain-containing protein [Acidobacteriota bacterium]
MNAKSGHLHLLSWYVSGKIGPKERQDIDCHLRDCEDCRAEVASLTSLMTSLQSQSQSDHIAAVDLVSYEEEPLAFNSGKRVALEGHLAKCPECREDLGTLRRARREESAPLPLPDAPRRQRISRRGWALTAAGAAAVLMLVAWPHRPGPSVQSPPSGNPSRAVFQAPRRGSEAGLTLEGTGPWTIRVVLPFDARQGPYRVQVYREDGGPSLLDTTSLADAEQCVDVFLTALSGPGRYKMFLTRNPSSAEDSYVYSFELLARSGSKPAS